MTVNTPQKATLIDTLSEGYRAVNRRPLLVLVPILLNLFLWFGVQVSFGPLLRDVYNLATQLQQNSATEEQFGAQFEQLLELGNTDMLPNIAWLNFVPKLSLATMLPVAGDTSGASLSLQDVPRPINTQATVVTVSTVAQALLVLVLVNTVAVALSAAFLTRLAEAVRFDRAPLAVWLRRVGQALLAILGYAGLFVAALVLIGVPVVLLTSVLFAVVPALGYFALALLAIAWFWLGIYIGFTTEAISISGIGPIQALKASVEIVRRNFWGTLGFVFLGWIISTGSSVLWYTLSRYAPVGLVVAIVGSAYIGSGLLAARMAFYRERLRRWQTAVGSKVGQRA